MLPSLPSRAWTLVLTLLVTILPERLPADATLLNVSYDVTREFYAEYNALFARHWQEVAKEKVSVHQSHGGSSKQARAVIDGLDADVVTMNQAYDIDMLFEKGRLIPRDWAQRLPNHSVPYTSTILFIVRKGNPKGIHDWQDLIRPHVSVVIPNPKTSGNGRYSYLAAWAQALQQPGGNAESAEQFVTALFHNVPVLDTGGRGASTTFLKSGIGDALLTFESEVQAMKREFGADAFEVVMPPLSILAENPVVWVDKVVARRNTAPVARAYLEYLYSEPGQELAARFHFRPSNREVLKRHPAEFPELKLVTVDAVFGGWAAAFKTHFAEGGIFDRIYQK